MEVRYIREFVVLCECMNYSQAAEKLYISQSVLSKHIKALEKDIGAPLFERTTRTIRLTEVGSFLLSYAKRITALVSEAETGLDIISRRYRHSLTIGVMHNPKMYNLSKYITPYTLGSTDASFNMIESDEAGLIEMFGKKQFNIFTAFEPQDAACPYLYMPLVRTRIEALMSSDHPLAQKDSLSLRDLSEVPILMPSRGSSMSRIILSAFYSNGISPNIIYEGSSLGCSDFVKEGIGISLHATEYCRLATEDPALTSLTVNPPIEFTYGVGYRDPDQLTAAEAEYLEHMKTFAL